MNPPTPTLCDFKSPDECERKKEKEIENERHRQKETDGLYAFFQKNMVEVFCFLCSPYSKNKDVLLTQDKDMPLSFICLLMSICACVVLA